jgi:hypothetical protein
MRFIIIFFFLPRAAKGGERGEMSRQSGRLPFFHYSIKTVLVLLNILIAMMAASDYFIQVRVLMTALFSLAKLDMNIEPGRSLPNMQDQPLLALQTNLPVARRNAFAESAFPLSPSISSRVRASVRLRQE